MATKPNYAFLLHEIAIETDPIKKQELIAQCYVFNAELIEEEKNLFNYMDSGYLEKNPDKDSYTFDNTFDANLNPSYVGKYFDEKIR